MRFNWNHARTFMTVADEGSLSAAAIALGQTQPTVSRQVAALEEDLGVTLFERTGRSVALTQAGTELLEHVRAMANGANLVSLAASGQSQSLEGQVRITASELMSAHILTPMLRSLRQEAPLLDIDLVADNRLRDLVRREADIAIRHARPEQPNLLAKRVGDIGLRFYASRRYVEERGQPTADRLAEFQFISFIGVDRMLGYLLPAGLDLTRENFRLSTSSQLVGLELARSGFGIMIVPEQVAARCPELVPVLPDIATFTIPTWLVAHRELRTNRRIRVVFDHLAAGLSAR